MAVTNAIIKAGEKALTKGSEKAIEKATTKAITKATEQAVNKAITKSVTRGLTGAGMSSLAPKAGSTLDGILGRSSGLVLPNAQKPVSINLAEKYADTPLAKTAKQEIAEIADRNNKLITDLASDEDNMWFSNRELTDTKIGDLYPGNAKYRIGSNPDTIIPAKKADIAKMIKDGKLKVADNSLNSNRMKNYELTNKPLSYDEKSSLLEAIKDALPEEEAEGLALEAENTINPNQLRLIDQDTSPREMKIEIEKPRTRKKNIDVALGNKEVKPQKVVADAGVDKAVAETAPATTNPALAEEIASLKAQIGSTGGAGAGMGNNGGGGMATDLPGSEGFRVKLKEGKTTNIQVGPSATGSTKQQRAVRKLDDMTAKSMNASAKQYRGLVGKSGSIDGHYKTVAERIRAEKIDQANVAQKAQSALSLREDIKRQGLEYAEANGVTLNLAGIDNTIGLSATQKRKLAELGLGLDEMLGGTGVVTPTQAEDIYKTLRDYAYNWSDSKDALTKMAGNACEKEANAVREMIDNTMDNINVDYKTSLLEEAAKNGEDPAYLRKLAGKSDFKFSDLRKDQSDWIAINDLAGNKIKNEPTLNIFGVDTGVNNPLSSGAEKIKEKIYERQAYGAGGAGGNNTGGGVPPLGGSGAENNINFTTVGGGTGTLGGLLGKAKSAGLVGAGILGGMALGGGGGGSDSGSTDFASMGYNPVVAEPTEEIDPYETMTIGGYTYDDLEAGYMAAIQAGDSDAAKLIQNMMGMLDDKVSRYYTAQKNSSDSSSSSSSSGSIAGKQKAALNVLSGLMSNYQSQGPIGGRFTQFMNALTGGGYAPGIAAYDSGAQGSLGTIIKALGDTGALSEGDQRRALELLPKTTDSEQAAKMKYQQLIQILQGAGAQ